MEGVNNYEDLKYSAKSVAQFVTSDNLHYGIFLLVILIVAWKAIDLLFMPFKKRKSVMVSFVKGCLKAFLAITIGMKIISFSETLSSFTSQILMSSSLIVVVLGFVFQEGLSNVVHGFILLIFKPFQIGDRVQATIDGVSVTGYVKSIDLRSTIIENVVNSSSVIVPNSKMDLCVIDNSYFDDTKMRSNFLDFSVTYESNLDKAIEITSMEIMRHPLVAEVRREQKIEKPVSVMVRDLGADGICLRASVVTKTVEDNFTACSDIRRALVYHFSKEPDVEFAYPHMQIMEEHPAETYAAYGNAGADMRTSQRDAESGMQSVQGNAESAARAMQKNAESGVYASQRTAKSDRQTMQGNAGQNWRTSERIAGPYMQASYGNTGADMRTSQRSAGADTQVRQGSVMSREMTGAPDSRYSSGRTAERKTPRRQQRYHMEQEDAENEISGNQTGRTGI